MSVLFFGTYENSKKHSVCKNERFWKCRVCWKFCTYIFRIFLRSSILVILWPHGGAFLQGFCIDIWKNKKLDIKLCLGSVYIFRSQIGRVLLAVINCKDDFDVFAIYKTFLTIKHLLTIFVSTADLSERKDHNFNLWFQPFYWKEAIKQIYHLSY